MRHHQNMPNMSHIRRGEKEAEIIFVKIITKNFLNWIKKKKRRRNPNLHLQEAQRTSSSMSKDKEKIFRGTSEKQLIIQRIVITLTGDLSSKTMEARK